MMTSSTTTDLKLQKDILDCRRLNVSDGASDVLDRTLATFSAKKRLNDETSMPAELEGRRPCPSRTPTVFHDSRGSD